MRARSATSQESRSQDSKSWVKASRSKRLGCEIMSNSSSRWIFHLLGPMKYEKEWNKPSEQSPKRNYSKCLQGPGAACFEALGPF